MNLWEIIIDDKSRYFEGYLALIKSTIDKETKKLDEDYNKFFKEKSTLNEENVYQGEEYFSDIAHEINETGQLLYRSFVVSMFIFIEQSTVDLCNHLFNRSKEVFNYKDLKGVGISRCINYLQKKLNHIFPSDSEIKNKLKIAQIIRNAIVHNDTKVNIENKNFILEQIKNGCPIKIDSYEQIELSYNYVKEMILLNEKICEEISSNWIEKN